MSEDNTKSQGMLLQTLQAITTQHADMYRELSSRFSTLEERSNNHGQELRRIANNVHDTRAECREAITKRHDELRSEIQRVDDAHRDDMARIQLRRHGDTP
jgi:predicted  nucleic acid-binding Zn-ribbon protein